MIGAVPRTSQPLARARGGEDGGRADENEEEEGKEGAEKKKRRMSTIFPFPSDLMR